MLVGEEEVFGATPVKGAVCIVMAVLVVAITMAVLYKIEPPTQGPVLCTVQVDSNTTVSTYRAVCEEQEKQE